MEDALVTVIKTYPGWTLFCGFILLLAIARGIEAFLTAIGKRSRG